MWTIPPIDSSLKDWLQALSWTAAAVGVIVATVKFWSELRLGRQQRDRDLRWRQAEAGKDLNDEMQTDPRAWPALQMLDSEIREFALSETERITVKRDDIRRALDPKTFVNAKTDEFVRDCFDALFYFMAMMEHYTKTTLVKDEDVAYPLEYYVPRLAEYHAEVSAYLLKYNLWRTKLYLERYGAWRKPSGPDGAAA